MSPKPELVVPIRDRRRGKRILTLKNARNVTGVALGLFVAFLAVSAVRKPKANDDYGRLLGQQIAVPAPDIQKAPQVITEGRISDDDHADPLLLSAAAREQYLGVEPNTTLQPVAPVVASSIPVPTTTDHATIVGDANGVTIVKTETQDRGVLGGGIFKQH